MQISKISIKNILGISEMELSPKGFTQISGPNGTGKTSMLEAVKAALASGHDATLLRKGEEKGEIVLVLDDGTEISKTVKANGSTTEVRRDGKKISRPAEAIKALTDLLSVNPVDFLMAPKKERVRVLLESMPLEADTEHLAELTGMPVKAQDGVHALHVISLVHQQVYDERTGTNRAVKEKQATIKQLEEAVPPAPDGVSGDEGELEAQIEEATTAFTVTNGRIDTKLTRLRQEHSDQVAVIRADLQAEIDKLKEAATARVADLQAGLTANEGLAAAAREKAMSAKHDTIQPLHAQLTIIRNDREAAGRRKQTLETIENLRTELEALTADATRLTGALDAIDQYKSDLLASLPIPGLEVKDGEILRDGVVFDRLNTAQQVEIAVEVAKLRAADLGIVCVDGLELLDTNTLAAFRESALASGLQMFITRVSDDASIETTD